MKREIAEAFDLSDIEPADRPRIAGLIRLYALVEVLRCDDCVIRDADGTEHRGSASELLAKKDLLGPMRDFIERRYLELRTMGSA